jgi:hypothetical protein
MESFAPVRSVRIFWNYEGLTKQYTRSKAKFILTNFPKTQRKGKNEKGEGAREGG